MGTGDAADLPAANVQLGRGKLERAVAQPQRHVPEEAEEAAQAGPTALMQH